MTRLTYHDVEQWMDANPDSRCDYFLRKADLSLVNKWLLCHGHDTVLTETKSACRRSSAPGHAPTVLTAALSSPLERVLDTHVEGRATTTTTSHSKPKPPPRSNSRKFLRQDFAKCKNTLLYRTCEAAVVSSEMPSSDVEARRNSLKNMRQYTSLPPSSLNMLSHLIESKIRLPRHVSKDAAQLNELRRTNEREFFLDIVKDIANEMDVRHLSSKVTQNIRLLLDVDHSSLFLIQKSHKGKVLVSKQFDAYTGTNVLLSTSGDNVVQVPWGTGIIGHVADSGETVNLTQASEDPRYDNEADRMTGYETNTLLCMPITDTDGVVIGVTQVINKRGGQEFTKDDEKLLQTYLSFFGIALANARLFEASRQEQLNNKALLEVVHDLFEEQDALDGIVLKIMQKTLRLLKCERCCVFLLDDNGLEVTFNKLFDLTAPNRTKSKQASGQANTGSSNTDKFADLRVAKRIIEQVASNGDVVNIADADMDFRIDHQANGLYDVQIKRLLCIPIRNRNTNIIGVTQIVNRTDGECFDETDEALFEAVAIFYGLGINNTIMYNEQKKITAMQSVALEVLSYHTSTSPQEAMVLAATTLPDQVRNVNLKELLFDNFSLNSMEMLAAGVEFFGQLGLVTKFNIDTQVLCRWLLTIRKNYRNVVYHNWCHAFNVCQTMFGILKTTDVGNKISDLEKLALLVGCFCHDLDHRGTNNAFHVKTQSPLALLYGTSATMEQHHFNHAVMILNSEGHNIFSSMSAADYSAVMNLLKEAILATDLLLHFKAYKNFGPLVAEKKLDETQPNHMHMLRSCLMTACDISACTKAWEIQCKVAEQIASEFWAQGDKEKQELKVQPAAQMDRERMHDLPKLQKQWLEGICLPLYTTLANLSDGFQPMLAGIEDNYKKWGELAETNSYEFSLVNGHAATPNASPTDLFAEQNQRSLLT